MKQFVGSLKVAVTSLVFGLIVGCGQSQEPDSVSPGQLLISGAGATFPQPLYERWMSEYQKTNPGESRLDPFLSSL